jgi:ABC-type Mn2+/Zn2+ transport system ATPase subunit
MQVGEPGEWGLSIEQRKRLTIAVELVANPSVIFMDEPTSGLDARAAAIVMRAVRNTVNTGRTVVCTIHQPSIDIIDVSACVQATHCCMACSFPAEGHMSTAVCLAVNCLVVDYHATCSPLRMHT